MQPVYIIAEAGVNHNGDVKLALQLVAAAAAAGADAVKFQTFRADSLVTGNAPKARYQTHTTDGAESQHAMLRKLELPPDAYPQLAACCAQHNIQLLSSPFDVDSVTFLAQNMDLPLLKIASGEISNAPLLLAAAQTGKPVILSTGMSDLGDIETALGVLAFGYTAPPVPPSPAAFRQAYLAGQRCLQEKVTLLHCTTEYPAPFNSVNLRAMDTLATAFGLPTGYSDHTPGIHIALAAAARGATVIEKHLTLDKTLPGPDHKASLEADEFRDLVAGVRAVSAALGHGRKTPAAVEWQNRNVARRSLVALQPVRQGDLFTPDNLGIKRPGTGIAPLYYWDWLGRRAERDYQADETI